jgi:hypothetical protein
VVVALEELVTSRTREGADTTRAGIVSSTKVDTVSSSKEGTVSSTKVGTVSSKEGVIKAATVMSSKGAKVITTRDIIVKKRVGIKEQEAAPLRTMSNHKAVDIHPRLTNPVGRPLCADPALDPCLQGRRRGDIRKDRSEKSSLPRVTGGGTGCLHRKKWLTKRRSALQCTQRKRMEKT